jgi:hypothetical protein
MLVFWLALTRHRDQLSSDPVYLEMRERTELLFDESPESIQMPVDDATGTPAGDGEHQMTTSSHWSELEAVRKQTYERQRGIFLVHTWRPSRNPGQVADVVMRLHQHGAGPLLAGLVKAVTYDFGPKFDPHTLVQTNASQDFRCEVSAFAPMLCLAQVEFGDDGDPITLVRYIDFEPPSRMDEAFVGRVQHARALVLSIRGQSLSPQVDESVWPGVGVPLPEALEQLLSTELSLQNALRDLTHIDGVSAASLVHSLEVANAGVTPGGVGLCRSLWSTAEGELNSLLE